MPAAQENTQFIFTFAATTDKNMQRIKEEQRTVEQMIRIYCRRKEGNEQLCASCAALLEYARKRLAHCPFGEGKKTCRRCPVHCYQPEMRRKIGEVMRYAGPRMLWLHPLSAVKHLWRERFV